MDSFDAWTHPNTSMPEFSTSITTHRNLRQNDYITASGLHVLSGEFRIHSLPVELLSIILRMLCDESALVQDALHYSGVCRLWREIFENTTAYWTQIHVGNVFLADLCIKNSGKAPLSFKVTQREPHAEHTFTFEHTVLVWKVLRDCIHRVRDLTLHITTEASEYVLPLLASWEAPELACFTLCDISTREYEDTHESTLGTTEDLSGQSLVPFVPISTMNPQRIICNNLLPLNPASPYTRLTHLDITLTREPANMTVWPITTFAHAAPALEYLRIEVNDSDLLSMDWGAHSELTDIPMAGEMDMASDSEEPLAAHLALTDIFLNVPSTSDVVDVFNDLNTKASPLRRVCLYIARYRGAVYMPKMFTLLPNALLEAMRVWMVILAPTYVTVIVTGRDCEVTLQIPWDAADAQDKADVVEQVSDIEHVFPSLEYHYVVSV